jgi:uncharacterized delta-60 repeat protein
VFAVAIQTNGSILLGGIFTNSVNGALSGFAVLRSDGRFNATFDVPTLGSPYIGFGRVYSINLPTDGSILIGGDFNSVNGVPRNGIARIRANPTGNEFIFSSSNYTIMENETTVLVTVLRLGDTSKSATLDYATSDGTATDADYTPQKGTLTFGPLETSKTIAIPILDDTVPEDPETFSVTLTNPSPGTSLGNKTTVPIIIQDNEPRIRFGGVQSPVTEGIPPAIIFFVFRDGSVSNIVTVDYATRDGTALAGADYLAVSGTFTFLPGEIAKSNTVPILNDLVVEPPETFDIVLSNPTGGAGLASPSVATVTIYDDEPTVHFDSPSALANERDGQVIVRVVREGKLENAASVQYATGDQSARASTDYQAHSGTLTFAPGESAKAVSIPLVNDQEREFAESFQVVLTNPSAGAALVFPSAVTVNITDDDVGQTPIEFDSVSYVANELDGSVQITVTSKSPSFTGGQFQVSTTDVTATAGTDYAAFANIFYLGPGQFQTSFSLQLFEDALAENDETILLTLSNPTGDLALGPRSSAVVTIKNAGNAVDFASESYFFAEGSNLANILVRRRGETNLAFTVKYATSDLTAATGKDYLAQSGILTFAAGQVTNSFTIPILDDFAINGTRLVQLTLSEPTGGAVLGPRATATLAITDDERPVALDPSFDSILTPDSGIVAMVVQPDGKIVLGGYLRLTSPGEQKVLLRLNPDGSLDSTFKEGASGEAKFTNVGALALDSSGKVLVAGSHPQPGSPDLFNIFRLLDDGTLDAAFHGGLALNQLVYLNSVSISPQADGKVYVLGEHPPSSSGTWNGIARLNADGSLDPTFDPGTGATFPDSFDQPPSAGISAIAVQSDAKIVIGGKFTSYNGVPRGRIARINADGSLDATFDPVPGVANVIPSDPSRIAYVNAVAIQSNGKILIGGSFNQVNRVERLSAARLNPDGSLDETFNPRLSGGQVNVIIAQQDGKILLGGDVFSASGVSGLARLNSDGSLDMTLMIDRLYGVTSIGSEADGSIIVAGGFTDVVGTPRAHLARVFSDTKKRRSVEWGQVVYSFNENETNAVVQIRRGGDSSEPIKVNFSTTDGSATAGADYLSQPGTTTLAAGENFKELTLPLLDDGLVEDTESFELALSNPIAGVLLGARSRARVDILDNEISAILDTSFDPEINGWVSALAVQPDGKTIIGGYFDPVANVQRFRVARLNIDGSPDTNFDARIGLETETACCPDIRALSLQPDGKILVGGYFLRVDGVPRNSLARLNPDGSLDATFKLADDIGGYFQSLALQSDLKVLIAGDSGIARLNSDGTRDTTFLTQGGFDGGVTLISPQADGRILVGGWFSTFNGVERVRAARLNADGSLDTSYAPPAVDPKTGNQYQRALAIQSDGRVILTGSEGGGAVLARLNPDGTLDSSFQYNPASGPSAWRYYSINLIGFALDGKLVIAGFGATPSGEFNAFRLNRLNGDGTLDSTFPAVRFDTGRGGIAIILPRTDGKMLIAGDFARVGGRPQRNLALLQSSQAGITSCELFPHNLAAGESEGVSTITVQRFGDTSGFTSLKFSALGGSAVAGVDFVFATGTLTFAPLETQKTFAVSLIDNGSINSDKTVQLTLSEPTGGAVLGRAQATLTLLDDERPDSLDFGFNARLAVPPDWANVGVDFIRLLPDDKFRIWGNFATVNGVERGGFAQLNPDGSLNPTVTSYSTVALAYLPNGMSYGYWNNRFVRFNADYSVDPSFDVTVAPQPYNIQAVAALPDGKLLVSGPFTSLNGIERRDIARLNADGSVDLTFSPGTGIENESRNPGDLRALAVQPDGRIVIGGYFSFVSGTARNAIAQLNADGLLDPTFDSAGSKPDAPRDNVASLAVEPGGSVLALGYFPTLDSSGRQLIARFNADGSFDSFLDVGTGPVIDNQYCNNCAGTLNTMVLQSDGGLLLGGNFTQFNGVPRSGIVRLKLGAELRFTSVTFALTDSLRLSFACQPGRTYRLEASDDLVNWTPLDTRSATAARVEFADTAWMNHNHRFYRAIQLPP